MDEALRRELLAMRDADLRRREKLARDGSLFQGYHPRMEEVHRANAARLQEIIGRHGWPGRALAGDDGAEAAWLIVQHAIGEPAFQRAMVPVLQAAAARGEVPGWQPAYLQDRICMYEGQPQIYGTQFLPGDDGLPAPWTIADPGQVNQRRAALGLDTIEERTAAMRRSAQPEERPRNLAAWRKEYETWLRRAGWRT